MKSSNYFEGTQKKFIDLKAYKEIYKDSLASKQMYQRWVEYERQRLVLNPLNRPLSTIFRSNFSLSKSSSLIHISNQHSSKFSEFVQPFGNSQYRINSQYFESIQNNSLDTLENHLNEIHAQMAEIQGLLNDLYHDLQLSIESNNLNKILAAQIQEQLQTKNRKITTEFYRDSHWVQRIEKADYYLKKIEQIKQCADSEEFSNKQKLILEKLENLSDIVSKYRRKFMKYMSVLVYSYTNISKKMMKGLYQMISIGGEIISNFIQELSAVNTKKSELQEEYQNCKYTKNLQYIKGLEFLKRLFEPIKKQYDLDQAQIQRVFGQKKAQLSRLKNSLGVFDSYHSFREKIVEKIMQTLTYLQSNQSYSKQSQQTIQNFLYFVRNCYREIEKRLEQNGHNQINQTTKSFTRVGLHTAWPHKTYMWLWDSIKHQSYVSEFIRKCETKLHMEALWTKVEGYKGLAQKMVNPTTKISQIRQKCKLYDPIQIPECYLVMNNQKVTITDKTKNSFIIPREEVVGAKIHKKGKFKIILNNKIEFKLTDFKSGDSLGKFENFLTSKSSKISNSFSPTKEKAKTQKELKKGPKKESMKYVLGDQQRKFIEKRKKEIMPKVQNVLGYQKFVEFEIKNAQLRDIYSAVFTDRTPYFANRNYPTFFAYVAEILGDKNYKTQQYDRPGPGYLTGSKQTTFNNCPIFSVRKSTMEHPLPKIPFIPSKCDCDETSKLYWIDEKEMIYLAEVRLTGASMFKGVVTKTLYRIIETMNQNLMIQICGKIEVDEKNKFGSVMKKGGKSDMQNITKKIGYEIQVAMDMYKHKQQNIEDAEQEKDEIDEDSLTDQHSI